ncbi:collagenase-like [Neocloeon triangulifer]|uniref:collagenase-like n=1 Tax=Neocloeon triangulifer TaxID=2078957 RepID=UPI00286EE38B|nr:collagenase-like [Neocloeon triangulifer]
MKAYWKLLFLLGLSILKVDCQRAENLKFKDTGIKNRTVTPEEMAKYESDPSYWQPKVDYIYRKAKKAQPYSAGISFLKPSNSNAATQITGGMKAKPKQFPWQILLIVDQSRLCGGTLISTEWVLAAAHCINGGLSFFVAAGGIDQLNDREKGKQTYETKISILHENFDPETAHNDIGLVKVKFYLSADVNVIRLPQFSDGANKFENLDNVLLSGYGRTADTGATSRYLMYVYLQTITNNVCARLFAPEYVPNSVLCTGPDATKSPCVGDSGNALTILMPDKKYTLIGIVSTGPENCVNFISTYTRVTSFLGWISRNTGIKILT